MATWEVHFLKLLISLALTAFVHCNSNSHFRELKVTQDAHVMKQVLVDFTDHKREKRDSHHSIRKRETSSSAQICAQQKDNFKNKLNTPGFSDYWILTNDSSENLALAWTSGNLLTVTTQEGLISSKPSEVYMSINGGKTFVNQNQVLQALLPAGSPVPQIHAANGLQKHPNDIDRVYLVGYVGSSMFESTSMLFYTVDGGSSFAMKKLPFTLEASILFHPSENYKDYLLVLTSKEDLWLSKDNGVNWKKIKTDVVQAKWAAVGPGSPSNKDTPSTIYCAVRVKSDEFSIAAFFGIKSVSHDNDLEKSEDMGETWKKVHLHVYSFGVQGKFLYVSVFLSAEGEADDKRIMEVSTDGGKTWGEVQLPSIEPDRFFSIVEMSDEMVFIHVDEPGNTGYGTLYTSDATGIVYSESLRNHLYPNYIDLTDFYHVSSIRGVYIASQMEEDQSIHTMISYDRGAEWKPIKRPEGVACKDESKDCYLQIHNQYSIHSKVRANPPLSVEAAKGLILVHGHVAAALQTTIPDVFITVDGGYTWRKALDGPHYYQIADQGGLLVAVPLVQFPKVVKFSTDEGQCWHSFNFTDENIYFTGLLTAPGNSEMTVAIWGYAEDNRTWKIHVIDFEKVITKNCNANDYEEWTPHFKNEREGCLLGVKETFKKIKKDSWCHNQNGLNPVVQQTLCPCTKADYDCDYGYHRVGSSENCVLDPMFKGPDLDICLRGHLESVVSQGYHKIPGDKCTNTGASSFHTSITHHLVDMNKLCVDGDRSVLDGEVKSAYLDHTSGSHKVRSNTAVLISVITIIVLVGLVVVAYFTRKTIFKKGSTYRYSQLNVGGDYDQDVTAATATHTSLYEDDSDEESRPISSRNTSTKVPAALQNGVLPKWKMAPATNFTGGGSSSSSQPKPVSSSNTQQTPKPAAANSDTSPLNVHFKGSSVLKSYHDDSDVDLLE